jgi:PAS domain S-box-containing protein
VIAHGDEAELLERRPPRDLGSTTRSSTVPDDPSMEPDGQEGTPAGLVEVPSASEERFRALLDSAPDAAVIVDDSGRITPINEQTERLFGYPREELIGRPVEVLLPNQLRAIHTGHRNGYLADPKTRSMGAGLELAGRRKDGTEFPIDISLSALTTDGTLLALCKRIVEHHGGRIGVEDAPGGSGSCFWFTLSNSPKET